MLLPSTWLLNLDLIDFLDPEDSSWTEMLLSFLNMSQYFWPLIIIFYLFHSRARGRLEWHHLVIRRNKFSAVFWSLFQIIFSDQFSDHFFRSLCQITFSCDFSDHFFRSLCHITFLDHFFRSLFRSLLSDNFFRSLCQHFSVTDAIIYSVLQRRRQVCQ